MRKFLLLSVSLLLLGVGGANTVKADPIRLYASSFSGFGGNVSYSDGKLQWKGTGDNVATAITVEAGAMAKFSKIKFTCSDLTEGATYRVMLTTSGGTNYISEINTTGDVTINFSDLTMQWGSAHPSPEVLATVTQVRIGGGTSGSPSQESPYEMTIAPSSFYVESEDEVLSIASTADWTLFSKMVASGVSPLNAQLTADVDAGSTMVGAENGKEYSGTFNGAGHTLTFNYDGSSDKVAPFKAVNGATIKDLITTGSITSTANLLGGIVGQVNGATTLNRCGSHMSITTTVRDNGRIGGLVARNANSGSSLTFTNCMYDGAINSSTNQAAGFVGWSPNATTISNCLVASTSITGGESNFTPNTITIPDGKYALYINKFGSSNQGSSVSEEQMSSGYVAYTLNSDITEGTLFFGQDLKAVSSSPLLTDNVAYKVFALGGGEYANWTNTISNNADWVTFSKLVANGTTSLNVTMTADVNAGSTMVGTSSNPYTGSFDGAGHTLTFNYDSSTSNEIAPFQYINNATISNLTTTGSINAQNIFGGIVGTAGGESTLNYCTSSMTLTANDNGDSNNGRVAGLVGRCADNSTPVGTSITFNNCIFDGSISSTQGSRCCGLVSWARSTSVIANNCLIAPTSVTNGAENIAATGGTDPKVTPTNCFYTTKFGYSSQGTAATNVEIASGALCYKLNGNTVPSTTYFFGQGKLNSSIVEDLPSLTSDASKKVLRLYGDDDVDHGYANPNGLLPDPANYGKLAWKLAWEAADSYYTNYLSPDKTGDTHTWNFGEKYLLTVGSAGATTLVLPFDANLPDGVKAYELSYTSGDAVTANEVNTISADKPVLINAEAGEYLFVSSFAWNANIDFSTHGSANASSTGYVTSNDALTGVYNTSMPFSYVPEGAYVLQNGREGLCFYQVDAENTIKITSFRAYLTAGALGARALSIKFPDDETAINKVQDSSIKVQDSEIFNLAGQRMSKLQKGVNIVNGKKIMVK